MKNKYVEIETRDGIAIIWMDEQDSKINKIGPDMIDTFDPMMDELEKDTSIKAAVMISRKKDFIAGADIEAFANVKKEGDWQPIAKKGHAILDRIQKSKKPVVAAQCSWRLSTGFRCGFPDFSETILPPVDGSE